MRNAGCGTSKKIDGDDTEVDTESAISNDIVTTTSSVRPIAPAYARSREKRYANDQNQNESNRYDSRGVKRKFPSSHDSHISETALLEYSPRTTLDFDSRSSDINCDGMLDKEEIMIADEGSSSDGAKKSLAGAIFEDPKDDSNSSCHNRCRQRNENHRPFVTIKGMVDGIRDELGPTRGTCGEWGKDERKDASEMDDDDLSCDSFSLSRVVVECKHRMRALLPNGPRFSECIQAVVYCFMYETNDADIIQVLRSTTQSTNAKVKNNNDKSKHLGPLLTDYYNKVIPNRTNINSADTIQNCGEDVSKKGSNDGTCKESNEKGERTADKKLESDEGENTNRSSVTMKIAVDRVWLDDPRYGHRANWKAIILPKLRRWVDAVYRIRQSDDKRYRLLTALSMAAANSDLVGGEQEKQQTRRGHARAAWDLVLEECDFLKEGMSGERYRIETQ